jgi:hypothetical protein
MEYLSPIISECTVKIKSDVKTFTPSKLLHDGNTVLVHRPRQMRMGKQYDNDFFSQRKKERRGSDLNLHISNPKPE